MKRFLVNIASLTLLLSSSALFAQNESEVTLFTNVNVFDGVHENLIQNANVVVTGNRITEISTEPLAVAGGKVIDGGGRTPDARAYRCSLSHHACPYC